MREVKRVALTGDESEALRTCLEVTIGRNPGNTSGDEWRVKVMRGVHRSAINAGGLSPALRSKSCVFNTDEAIRSSSTTRLLERLRLDRDRAQRAADLAVVAAEAAADTKEEETEDLDAAIIAAAEREAAAAEVLCDARARKAAARDGRDARARRGHWSCRRPRRARLPGPIAAGPAARPRAAPVPLVAVSTFLRPVVWAVAKALADVYMDREGKDAGLSLVAFVDKFALLANCLRLWRASSPTGPPRRSRAWPSCCGAARRARRACRTCRPSRLPSRPRPNHIPSDCPALSEGLLNTAAAHGGSLTKQAPDVPAPRASQLLRRGGLFGPRPPAVTRILRRRALHEQRASRDVS